MSLALLTGLLSLSLAELLFAVLALTFAGLLALALLTLALLALLAFLARVELFLKVAERLVRQLLLLAKRLRQPLHGLLAGALLALTGTFA